MSGKTLQGSYISKHITTERFPQISNLYIVHTHLAVSNEMNFYQLIKVECSSGTQRRVIVSPLFRGVFITGSLLYITAISQNSSSLCVFHLLFYWQIYFSLPTVFSTTEYIFFIELRLADISCCLPMLSVSLPSMDFLLEISKDTFAGVFSPDLTLDNSGFGHSHRAYLNIRFRL